MVALASKLPYWQFDDDLMVFDDLSLGVGYKLQGIDLSLIDDQGVNDFYKNLHIWINSLPNELNAQLRFRKSSNCEDIIDSHLEIARMAAPNYLRIVKEREEFLRKSNEKLHFFKTELFIFFRSNAPKLKNKKLFENIKRYQQLEKSKFQSHKRKFLRTIEAIESGLHTCKFNPVKLDKSQWKDLTYEYLNPKRFESLKTPSSDDFVNGLTLSDLIISKNKFELDGKQHCFVNLKDLPDTHTYASMISKFLSLHIDFELIQNFRLGVQKQEIEAIKLKRKVTHSFSANDYNITDVDQEAKLNDMESLLRDLVGAEKLVGFDFNVLVSSESSEELDTKTDLVLKAFNDLEMSQGVRETLTNMDSFIACLPSRCTPFREKKLKSSNLAHLMPVLSQWEGNDEAYSLFTNRQANLIALDIFERSLSSWNGIVIGSSGSGKSFTLNQIILQYYGQKERPQIVWIDNGASSKRLIEVLDGSFIDLGIDSGIRVNLFDLPKGETRPSPSKVKFILAVLESIFKEEDSKGLPKLQKALLERVISETYRTSFPKIPTLSDFRIELEKIQDPRIDDFSKILYSWCGNTAFGKMLDGKTTISLDKDLTTIELKGLDSYPELQDVMLLIFTDFIRNKMMEDRTKKSLLIVDEAWKLFDTPCGANFAIEAFRTFRKFRAGIWAISQNINDFKARPEIANAILQNTPNRIILRQSGANWEDFQKTLSLNDREVEVIQSLKKDKGNFSELLMIQEENKTVLRLTPSPLSYWICTTDPADQKVIDEEMKKHPNKSLIEVLEVLAKEIS